MLRVARFLRGYLTHPAPGLVEEEVWLDVQGVETPATYVRPAVGRPVPGWIVLHGITVPGRQHATLRRFVHALAASGAAVLIPEVPAWRALRVDRSAGDHAIAAAARHLAAVPDVVGPFNLVGFSFGGTQALTSSSLPEVRDHIGSVVSFGGYCSFARTIHFMMTGEHEWAGTTHRLPTDPYGRWIVVANYLPHVPGLSHMAGLREAAAELAAESGRRGVYAGDPLYDPLKEQLGARLSKAEREVWEVIAGPSGTLPPLPRARELSELLIEAVSRVDPGADPEPRLQAVDRRVVLAHGLEDLLIPYTEALRLHALLARRTDVSLSVTRLFAHSRGAAGLGFLQYPREVARYVRLLNRALTPG